MEVDTDLLDRRTHRYRDWVDADDSDGEEGDAAAAVVVVVVAPDAMRVPMVVVRNVSHRSE